MVGCDFPEVKAHMLLKFISASLLKLKVKQHYILLCGENQMV